LTIGVKQVKKTTANFLSRTVAAADRLFASVFGTVTPNYALTA